MAATRAKFKLTKITQYENGGELEFHPVTGGSDENKSFFKYTPSGSIQMTLVNQEVIDAMQVGAEYYVDFTQAGE